MRFLFDTTTGFLFVMVVITLAVGTGITLAAGKIGLAVYAGVVLLIFIGACV